MVRTHQPREPQGLRLYRHTRDGVFRVPGPGRRLVGTRDSIVCNVPDAGAAVNADPNCELDDRAGGGATRPRRMGPARGVVRRGRRMHSWNDYKRFEELVDGGVGGAQVVGRFLEFFTGRIANARTRAAYGRAVGQFLGWCEVRGLRLRDVSPLHVAAYIRTHAGSAPTVKQHLAAIRMLGDWLVVSQVLPVNPALRSAGRSTSSSRARRRSSRWRRRESSSTASTGTH